jgi:DNA replication protein DnaC
MDGLTSIDQVLRKLKLQGMVNALATQQTDPKYATMPFEQGLVRLLEQELLDRDNRKITRLVNNAKFRFSQAVLEDVDYHAARELDPLQIQTLATGNWLHQNQSLILMGKTGTGKSWLACAFGQQACRQGISVLYMTATRLFENLYNAQADGSLPKLRRQLAGTGLLIIDDLDIGGIHPQVAPILLDILDTQSMIGSLILTSQFPTNKWYELFGDPTIADAILDRIVTGRM